MAKTERLRRLRWRGDELIRTACQAYRRYLIPTVLSTGAWWIEKDGFLICHAKSLADAKTKIDGLLEDTKEGS